ncbi:energy transducer TonB [Pseudoroseomonas globiformis]|uniref:Energy transducer TonB n=1 Tax=Teichococcus globiformis TaxID=2307229 RepID=A0ABV7G311_9PROT
MPQNSVASRPAAPPASYINRISASLERAKRYPNVARIRRLQGVGVLEFSMQRNGQVTGWRIVRSSGHAELDEAIGEMIQRASPLPPPPEEVAGNPVVLTVPVSFALR